MPSPFFIKRLSYSSARVSQAQMLFNNWLAANTTTPDSTRQTLILDVYMDMVATSNVYTQLDGLWFMGAHSTDSTKINVANPTATKATHVNSPTVVVDRHVVGNGTTQYIDTNLNASQCVYFLQNGATIGTYQRNNSDSNSSIGIYDVTTDSVSGIFPRNGGVDYFYLNDDSDFSTYTRSAAAVSSERWKVVQRTGSANTSRLRYQSDGSNFIQVGNQVGSLSSKPTINRNFYVLARNLGGVADSFTNHQVAVAFVGGGSLDLQSFHDIVQDYLVSIGANV